MVKDGQVVGVVGLDLSLDVFSSSISNIKIGDEGVVVVCSSNGDIVSHTDEGLIGKNLIEVDEKLKSVVDDNSGFIELSNNGKRNFVVYNLNSLKNIKLVAFIPEIELLKDTNAVRNFLIIGIIVIGIVATIINIILGEGIAKNMKKVKKVISKAAKGDFTGKVEIKSKDDLKELGDYFNNMMKSIALLMKNVDKSSRVVLKTAADLAIMSNETTTALSQTHIAMDEIASGASNHIQCANHMEDLAVGIDNIENSSTEIDSISKVTKNYSIEGSKIVSELINSSTKIKDTFEVVGNIVKEVNESMDQINLISKTISDITEQTNLLSLNASIEAARSGETGKGFAVVANEIRRLADQSKSSTDRINVMIKAIEEKSMLAVSAINNSQQVVDEEGKMVSETSQIFENISGSVLELSSKISEIKKSIENIQYEKINVVREIENITSISESTASATEEISASTEEITANMDEISRYTQNLNELSETLKFEISKFIIE
ncbi:methyl-accepting chemotaxis protein [Clostridium sp. UBA7503]|uniref:methyl-accepting chemotaxis protein n=1 Tax=Clostridium sp. UBA7503 TaxID=1946377 RepID=UPI0032163D33